jgi:hypothetical protein
MKSGRLIQSWTWMGQPSTTEIPNQNRLRIDALESAGGSEPEFA